MAYFNVDPECPCWALVLSVVHALILRWCQADNRFTRIGAVDWYKAEKWDCWKKAHCAPTLTSALSRDAMVKSADGDPWKVATIMEWLGRNGKMRRPRRYKPARMTARSRFANRLWDPSATQKDKPRHSAARRSPPLSSQTFGRVASRLPCPVPRPSWWTNAWPGFPQP
jgi:hypothetical protein